MSQNPFNLEFQTPFNPIRYLSLDGYSHRPFHEFVELIIIQRPTFPKTDQKSDTIAKHLDVLLSELFSCIATKPGHWFDSARVFHYSYLPYGLGPDNSSIHNCMLRSCYQGEISISSIHISEAGFKTIIGYFAVTVERQDKGRDR